MMWSFIESEKCSPFWLSQLYISYLMSLHSDCICLFSSTLIRCSYQIHLIPWAWKKLEWTKHGTENCEIFPMLLLVSCILKLCLLKYAWFRWSTGTSYSFFYRSQAVVVVFLNASNLCKSMWPESISTWQMAFWSDPVELCHLLFFARMINLMTLHYLLKSSHMSWFQN